MVQSVTCSACGSQSVNVRDSVRFWSAWSHVNGTDYSVVCLHQMPVLSIGEKDMCSEEVDETDNIWHDISLYFYTIIAVVCAGCSVVNDKPEPVTVSSCTSEYELNEAKENGFADALSVILEACREDSGFQAMSVEDEGLFFREYLCIVVEEDDKI